MTAAEYRPPRASSGEVHDPTSGEAAHTPARIDFERELTRRALRGTLFGAAEPVRLGRFELTRVLGRGSVGLVCEALDSENGQRMALKILERVDSKQVYRLKREFRSLVALRHPNLVAIHELFRGGDEWFFSMELVAGISFERWVRPGGQLDQSRLRDALCQLVEAVECIHAAGRVHCDLKPGNVLVADRARVVVLDFGLCREHGLQPRPRAASAEITGTPAYMAPEQAAGDAAGVHSDWYALGVMLFEALTGRLPFDGDAVQVLHDKQRLEAPDPRRYVAEPLPHDLCQLCLGLLHCDARRRFGSRQVRAIVSRLGPGRPPAGPSDAAGLAGPPGKLVGRERELQVLLGELAAARAQRPRAVLISGGCGVGKSALLDGFAQLTASSALVLRGNCRAQEVLPYKVFDELMDAFGQHLAELRSAAGAGPHPVDDDGVGTQLDLAALLALFPALGQLIGAAAQPKAAAAASFDPARLRFEALRALCQLFARWVQSPAVILLVDDLQWGDVDSARLLRQLLQTPQPLPLLFVGALRSEESDSEFLPAFGHEPRAAAYELCSIELGVLDQVAARRLARQRLAVSAPGLQADATRIAREAEGLPHFIGALAEHAAAAVPHAGTWLQATLADVLLDRSQALPEGARHMLQVLSIAAGPLELSLVCDTARLHERAAQWPALSALLHGRWIRMRANRAGTAPQADVYHPRIREIVLNAMPADQRRSLHAQLARTMEREGRVDDERLLVQLQGGGEGRQAGLAAITAAHRAMGELNFGLAARLFERAVDSLTHDDPRRGELYEHLGDALARLDEAAGAAEAYLSASQRQVAESSLRLRALAAQQFLRCAQLERGKALARSVFHGLGRTDLAGALAAPPTVALASGGASGPTLEVWSRAVLAWRRMTAGARRMTRQNVESQTCGDVVAALWLELSLLEPHAGAVLHASFERQARRAREPLARLSADAWRITRSAMPGSARSQHRTRRALPRLRALGAASATPRAAALCATADAAAHLFAGRYAAALAAACRADELLASPHAGAAFERAWAASLRHAALEFTGDLREMVLDAQQRACVARRRDDRLTSAVLVPSLANAQLVAGEPRAALALLERERGAVPAGLPLTRPLIASRTADAWLYQDQPVRALAYMRSVWPELEQTHLRRGAWQRALCHGARLRCGLAVFRHEPSAELRQSIEHDLCVLARQPCAAGMVHALAASYRHQLGDHAGAIDHARRALARFELDRADRAALYARRRLGELTGGAQGETLIANADRALAPQLTDPARWVAIHLGAL